MAATSPLYEMVYQAIRTQIMEGKYQPGDKLPSEKELEEAFSVSRITAKQAMNMLAKEGIVVRRPGLGSFVSDQVPAPEAMPYAARQGGGHLLGLVMEDFSPSYGLSLLLSIEGNASRLGYDLCVKRTLGDQAVEARAIDSLVAAGVQGIIMMPTHGKSYNTGILRLVVEGFPLIFVDRHLSGIPAPFVGTDNVAATHLLMDRLFALGHRDIAMITPPDTDATTISDRITGFTTAYKRHGIVRNKNHILDDVRSTIPSQAQAGNQQADTERIAVFLQTYPEITAVVAAEYAIARMVQTACGAIGRDIPKDLSLACFDDIAPEYSEGFFAHIRQDETSIGRIAVETLHRRVQGEVLVGDRDSSILPASWQEGRSLIARP